MQAKQLSSYLLGAATVLVVELLFRGPAPLATAQENRAPFASSVEQRQATIEELRKIEAILEKQNDLLTSGRVKVVVLDQGPEEKPEKGARRGR